MSERIDSGADARVPNSSVSGGETDNIMRHQYSVLSDGDRAHIKAIKDAGLAFVQVLDAVGAPRDTADSNVNPLRRGAMRSAELTLATRKIQEAVMWATNHVTGDKR